MPVANGNGDRVQSRALGNSQFGLSTIIVVRNGRGAKSKLRFFDQGVFLPDIWLDRYTDDDGVAYFEVNESGTQSIAVHARGRLRGKYEVDDGDQITIDVTED
jgi:hypothetical protein